MPMDDSVEQLRAEHEALIQFLYLAPVFLVGFITSEGLFWARLSAASTMAVLPVILAGWVAQKWLVRGLSLGAVK